MGSVGIARRDQLWQADPGLLCPESLTIPDFRKFLQLGTFTKVRGFPNGSLRRFSQRDVQTIDTPNLGLAMWDLWGAPASVSETGASSGPKLLCPLAEHTNDPAAKGRLWLSFCGCLHFYCALYL